MTQELPRLEKDKTMAYVAVYQVNCISGACCCPRIKAIGRLLGIGKGGYAQWGGCIDRPGGITSLRKKPNEKRVLDKRKQNAYCMDKQTLLWRATNQLWLTRLSRHEIKAVDWRCGGVALALARDEDTEWSLKGGIHGPGSSWSHKAPRAGDPVIGSPVNRQVVAIEFVVGGVCWRSRSTIRSFAWPTNRY